MCEIPCLSNFASPLGDNSKSVRFEKFDFKTLENSTAFGAYINVRGTLAWEFKLFVFHRIAMILAYNVNLCAIEFCNNINPFITKHIKNYNI